MDAYETALAYFDARTANDIAAVASFFHEDVAYAISGDNGSSRLPCDVAGAAAFRVLLMELVNVWPWRKVELLDHVAGDDRAAVRFHLTIEHAPSGRLLETDVFDLFEFRDGKIVRLIEHVDTAYVERIVGAL